VNCKNCAGTLEIVPNRDYYKCSYCDSLHFPKENSENIKIFNQKKKRFCPKCKESLNLASIHNIKILHCEKCRGNLIRAKTMNYILSELKTKNPHLGPIKSNVETCPNRNLNCPFCRSKMDSHPYHGQGNVSIDSCGKCYVIWFDYGELSSIR